MKLAGEATVDAPVDRVWDAILDPAVLVRAIPGCEKLETTGEHSYAMTVTAGVAAIKGTYAGTCSLSDLQPHESLVLAAQGSGAPGTIAADVAVRFRDNGDDTTTVSYDADTTVGGMIGGVGQRMLGSVSKRMAGEFFGNVGRVIAGGAVGASDTAPGGADSARPPGSALPAAGGDGGTAPATGGQVFTAPGRSSPAAGAPSRVDFLQGVAVGAGLVLVGVAAGVVAAGGRRLPRA